MAALLQPAGPDLARRWVSALMLVDARDRAALVSAMERAVHKVYPLRDPTSQTHDAIHPEVMLRLVHDAPDIECSGGMSDAAQGPHVDPMLHHGGRA